eukprot:PhF_6_TR15950/c0_g1_i1/m.24818
MKPILLVVVFSLCLSLCTAQTESWIRGWVKRPRLVPMITTTILPPLEKGKAYVAGSEIRVKLSLQTRAKNFFNVSAGQMAIRVIAAYTGRLQTGTKLSICNTSNTDVWQTSQDVGTSVYKFGRDYSLFAYGTFTVPPFPWRICMKNVFNNSIGTPWLEIPDQYLISYSYNYTSVYWQAPTALYEGDYAALRIFVSDATWRYQQRYPPSSYQYRGDNVKLVPAGYPCTYEKTTSRDKNFPNFLTRSSTSQFAHYCGSRAVDVNGHWTSDACMLEGSVVDGVAVVGTSRLNPLVDTIAQGGTVTGTSNQTAYIRLPAAGSYDVCYSSAHMRQYYSNRTTESVPLWMKLFKAGDSGCSSAVWTNRRACKPTVMRLVITSPSANPITWSMNDTTEKTWGSIKFTSTSATLSSAKVTEWDCNGCTKNYFITTGGDAFRFVPYSLITSSTVTRGELQGSTNTGLPRLSVTGIQSTTYGTEQVTLNYAGKPDLGSVVASAGCWYNAGDNYGAMGSTINSAADTSSGDTDDSGVSASGDLGSDPRSGKMAYREDLTSQNSVFGYVRVPSAVRSYYVCYRPAGISTWQILRTSMGGTTLLPTLKKSSRYANFTFSLNDTRGGTYGNFLVLSRFPILNTMPSLFYSSRPPPVQGFAMKLVKTTQSCDTDLAPFQGESWDAGLPECPLGVMAACQSGTCGCEGRTDDSLTKRNKIAFYLRVPTFGVSHRVCFRFDNYNWFQLSTITPTAPPRLELYLPDRRGRTWAPFRIKSATTFTKFSVLDARRNTQDSVGDVMRLIVNTTNKGSTCDVALGDKAQGSAFQASSMVWDLGIWCGTGLQTSSTLCDRKLVTPYETDVPGLSGTFPYSDMDGSNDNDFVEYVGTVGFMTLPASGVYRLCYKQAGKNWFEVSIKNQLPYFTIVRPPVYALNVPAPKLYAGMYTYFEISGDSWNPSTSVLKLVLDTFGCDRPAAGGFHKFGKYMSSTHPFQNRTLTDENSGTFLNKKLTRGRAYLALPTTSSGNREIIRYKVCFIDQLNSDANWMNVGTVDIESLGVSYTVDTLPRQLGTLQITLASDGFYLLNTTRNADSVKVVPVNQYCLDNSVDPVPLTGSTPSRLSMSLHVGLELSQSLTEFSNLQSISAQTNGNRDLGPSDSVNSLIGTISTTLPLGPQCFRVCYRKLGYPWTIVEQSPLARRKYNLGSDGLCSITSDVTDLNIHNNLTARYPLKGRSGANVTMLIGGASTIVTPGTSALELQVPSFVPTSNLYFLDVTATTTSSQDDFKLVLLSKFSGQIWEDIVPQPDCTSPPVPGTAVKPVASTKLIFNLPTYTGRFLACYRRRDQIPWLQIKTFYVTQSFVGFESLARTIQLTDAWTGDIDNLVVPYGSLSTYDIIYIANQNGTCGYNNSYRSTYNSPNYEIQMFSAPLNGTGNLSSSNVSVQLRTTDGLSFYPVPTEYASGVYKICYLKQVDHQRVNSTTGTRPLIRGGQWYQIPQAFTQGVRDAYYPSTVKPTLSYICPSFNLTRKLRAGTYINIDVAISDRPRDVPIRIEAKTNGFSIQNTEGSCSFDNSPDYSWPSDNSWQFSNTGAVTTFRLAPTSECPFASKRVCTLQFTSSAATSTQTCSFTTQATSTEGIQIVSVPTSCALQELNQQNVVCSVRIAAIANDKGVDYISKEVILITFSTHLGLQTLYNDASDGVFIDGYYNANFTFKLDPSTVRLWTEDIPVHNVRVTYTVRGKGIVQTSVISIQRPTFAGIRIVDFYPATSLNKTNNFNNIVIPPWEPSATFLNSFWNPESPLSQQVTASKAHYMVAQHPYTAIIVAVDAQGRPLPHVDFISSADRSITIAAFSDGNVILDGSGDDTKSFQPVSFGAVQQSVTFRLKNTLGCRLLDGGCKLVFKFGNKDKNGEAFIRTYVRGPAVYLRAICGAGGQNTDNAITLSLFPQCPTSAVEKGFTVKIEAIDQFGFVDEYFEGLVSVNPSDSNAKLTTLANFGNPVVPKIASAGVVVWNDLTLATPCFADSQNCVVEISSNWGSNMTTLTFGTLPSSTQLRCRIATKLFMVTPDANSPKVSGTMDPSVASQVASSLIYGDQEICVDVWAANNDGVATLYEKNWVISYPAWGGVTGTIRDSPSTPGRVRAMTNSKVRFCFTATSDSDIAPLTLNFAAQKFKTDSAGADHWAISKGSCSVGPVTIRNRKFIGGIVINSVTGMQGEVNKRIVPTSTAWYYTQLDAPTTKLSLDVSLGIIDHYGANILSDTKLVLNHRTFYVMPDSCTLSNMKQGTCSAGTGDVSTAGTITSTPLYPIAEGGALTVNLTSFQAEVVGIQSKRLSFSYSVEKFCISCTISYSLRIGGDADAFFFDDITGRISAALTLSVLLPTLNGVQRFVAYKYLKSPEQPVGSDTLGLTRSSWAHHVYTNSTPSGWDFPITKPMLIHSGCHVSNLVCYPKSTSFLNPTCDETNAPDTIEYSKGVPLEYYVLVSSVEQSKTLSYGSPVCTSDTSSCLVTKNVVAHVDILQSYTLQFRVGTQTLKCIVGNCIDDLTNTPKVVIPSYGATIPEALRALTANLKTGVISFQGTRPSDFVDRTVSAPSMKSPLIVSAVANSTDGVFVSAYSTGDYEFVWKVPERVTALRFVDIAADTQCTTPPTYWKFDDISGSSYQGYPNYAPLQSIGFNYSAGNVFVNTPFPLSVELQNQFGKKCVTATGSIVVSKQVTSGCNDGGTFLVTPSSQINFVDGRATFWVTFSDPCQSCIVKVVFTPDVNSAISSSFRNNIGAFTIYSRPISVRTFAPGRPWTNGNDLVYITEPPSTLPSVVSVQDLLTLRPQVMYNFRGLPIANDQAVGFVGVHNVIQNSKLAFIGNGGTLRSSTATTNSMRHGVRVNFVNGKAKLDFAFQRACDGCMVIVTWGLTRNRAFGAFLVRNGNGTVFQVRVQNSIKVLVGYLPRIVYKDAPFYVSIWNVAFDPVLGIIGVGANAMDITNPSFSVVRAGNGDGGQLTSRIMPRGTTQIHSETWRIQMSQSCDRCLLQFGNSDLAQYLFVSETRATKLVITSLTPQLVQPDEFITAEISAFDDFGFVDVSVGRVSDCALYLPFDCAQDGELLQVAVSADGMTPGGFIPSVSQLETGGGPQLRIYVNISLKIFDGRTRTGVWPARFASNVPLRNAVPIFYLASNPQLSSASLLRPGPRFDVDVGLADLTLAVAATNYTTSINTNVVIYFGAARGYRPDLALSQFAAVRADYLVNVSLVNCPKNSFGSSSRIIQLFKGIGSVTLAFNEPSTTCSVRLNFVSKNVSCTVCTTSTTINVVPLVANKWIYVAPTAFDNGRPITGPTYGAMDRTTYIRVQLVATDTSGNDVPTGNCGSATCTFMVRSSGCEPSPAISPGTGSAFDSKGYAEIRVRWASTQSQKPYTCTLSLSVLGTTMAGPTIGSVGSQPVVTVCAPSRLVLATNITSASQWRREQYIRTGVLYPFEIQILDKFGSLCPGDSQDDASTATIELVGPRNDVIPGSVCSLINANTTNVLNAAGTNVRITGGGYRFMLAFTGSMYGKPIRIRVNSTLQATSLYTASFETNIVAARLRLRQAPFNYFVTGKLFNVTVEAVDAVRPEWNISANVARQPYEPGNALNVEWYLDSDIPRPFPFSFSSGNRIDQLKAGEKTFTMKYSDKDDTIQVGVVDQSKVLTGITPWRATFQTISRLSVSVSNISLAEGGLLTVDTMTIDPLSKVVLGDNETQIQISMKKPAFSKSSVEMRLYPGNVQPGPFQGTMSTGKVSFAVTFFGTTAEPGTDIHTPIQISVTCVKCEFPLSPILTENITIRGVGISPSAYTAQKPILRIPTTLKSINDFDVDKFRSAVAVLMEKSRVGIVTTSNAAAVVQIVACEVTDTTVTLSGKVCGGNKTCANVTLNACPVKGVVRCKCGDVFASSLGSHHSRRQFELQQQNVTVQTEVTFDLTSVSGFSSEQDVTSAYSSLTTTLVQSLQSGDQTFASFNVDPNGIVSMGTTGTTSPTTKNPTQQQMTPLPTIPTISPARTNDTDVLDASAGVASKPLQAAIVLLWNALIFLMMI